MHTRQAVLYEGLTFQNRDWPGLGAILTDYQATNATQSCFSSFNRRDAWANVGTEIILRLFLAKTTRILILKGNFKTMENMAP